MDIREFNQRFDHVSGPNSAGEYTMRCPCHDDKTASLTARVKGNCANCDFCDRTAKSI